MNEAKKKKYHRMNRKKKKNYVCYNNGNCKLQKFSNENRKKKKEKKSFICINKLNFYGIPVQFGSVEWRRIKGQSKGKSFIDLYTYFKMIKLIICAKDFHISHNK